MLEKGRNKVKVLLVGSGGREHALAYKISESPQLTKLYAAPGNPGIAEFAELVDIKANDIEGLVDFCVKEGVDFVVVGPEEPLTLGLVDALQSENIAAFGPDKAAARLESSKVYAKDFMKRYSIPTARYESYSSAQAALDGLKDFKLPVVIKADGLAAGKGVIIAESEEEARTAIRAMMEDKKFGNAGNSVVLEEFLTGIEASQFCFVDGRTILPLIDAQDYKREYDNDEGENTGGMGSHSPGYAFNDEVRAYVKEAILEPFLRGINAENLDYRGLVFIGLMIEGGRAKAIEFNVRFGDPETQSLVLRMDFDLLDMMLKTAKRDLEGTVLKWKEEASLSVIMASGGYPRDYEKAKLIEGLDGLKGVRAFHSGTKREAGRLVTNGGRVLALATTASSLEEARAKVYEAIKTVHFEGAKYRTDIGLKK